MTALNAYSWEADSNKCNEGLIPIAAKLWQRGAKIKVNTLDIILYLKLDYFLCFIIEGEASVLFYYDDDLVFQAPPPPVPLLCDWTILSS